MLNIFTVVTTVCVALGALWFLFRPRRRDLGFTATVSREWLVQHQGDDRS
jgi:hypothetical protein